MRFLQKSNKLLLRLHSNHSLSSISGQTRKCSSNSVRLSYHSVTPINAVNTNCGHNLSPILIFHGLFGTKNNWKTISKAIASKTGRSVYSFDLRNHGSSPHTSGADSHLIGMSNDIQLFLDENHLEKASLVGHSLGGRAVMQLAFLWPERVEKLIVVDISPISSIPSAFFLNPMFIEQLSKAIENISSDLSLSEARNQVNQSLKQIIPDNFIRGFFLMSLDKDQNGSINWRYHLPAIKHMIENNYINDIQIAKPYTGEVLLIHGQNSDYVKNTDYNAIREVMPKVKFVSIPETGHYLHIEKPNEFINSLVSFVNS